MTSSYTMDPLQIFLSAVDAVKPKQFMHEAIRLDGDELIAGSQRFILNEINRIVVLGAGKASAAMALELEKILGDRISGGMIVTKYDHSLPLNYLQQIEAGHPIPDDNSLRSAQLFMEQCKGLESTDLVICLISGGASSLIADPAENIQLVDLQQLNQLLLDSGAGIQEINTVRKHLSTLKGGQLLRMIQPARSVSLIISDVIGDDLSAIGSGLTQPDHGTFTDACTIVNKYQLQGRLSRSIIQYLQREKDSSKKETLKPEEAEQFSFHNIIVASNRIALEAAAGLAKDAGYKIVLSNEILQGEAAERGIEIARTAANYLSQTKTCLIYGGETTVKIKGSGLGGRNQELALAALIELAENHKTGEVEITLISAGTDGTDGPTDATGAFINNDSIMHCRNNLANAKAQLSNNDSYHYFEQAGGLIKTGPTQTNVMDMVLVFIGG